MYATGADITVIDAPNKGYDDSNVRFHPDGTLAYTGISCVLFKSSVFETIPEPWFSTSYEFLEQQPKDGKIVWEMKTKYQDDNQGEDVYFIRKAIEHGLSINIVPDLKCKHHVLAS